MRKKGFILWFLLGLGDRLQFWASLSFSEAFVLLAAVCLFPTEFQHMRRTGVIKFFYVSLSVVCGCAVACFLNHSPFSITLRGMAVCSIIACSVVVSHWLLRTRTETFKWYFLGLTLSMIISTFFFQSAGEDGKDLEEVMSGPLFWVSRLSGFATLPAYGWYMQTPTPVVCILMIGMAMFSVLSSVSGRSAAIGFLGAGVMAMIGGRKRRTIRRVSKYFWLLVMASFVAIFMVTNLYRLAATQGWLGAASQEKYENQTHGDKRIVSLLIGGRIDSFVGLFACFDKPIVGWGPWAADVNGYYDEFLSKYGAPEDYEQYRKMVKGAMARGNDIMRINMIPVHSMIVQFWCWYGITGLIYVIMCIYIFTRYIKDDVYVVPQWYFWLACIMIARFWNIGFSPFAQRVMFPMAVVGCLLARAVRLGKMALPFSMVREIEKREVDK